MYAQQQHFTILCFTVVDKAKFRITGFTKGYAIMSVSICMDKNTSETKSNTYCKYYFEVCRLTKGVNHYKTTAT